MSHLCRVSSHELVVEKSHFSSAGNTTQKQRPRGLNTLPPMFPSLQGRFQSKTMNVVSLLLCTVGLYYFAHSFFLAKRNLPNRATCDEAPDLLQQYLGFTQIETDLLQRYGLLLSNSTTSRNGCWMSRRIDSLVIIIIDALRFDFALYNLPQSVGKRIAAAAAEAGTTKQHYSRLVQFVADPPTVTMQRIKGLTTGGVSVLWMIL
jgi:GPI ethanolamine phosphate transferase 3 subunit O